MTTYQRMQALRLREVREELRGRDCQTTAEALDRVQSEWQAEDSMRFLLHIPGLSHRRLGDDSLI